jgi:hypothetical protein
VAAPAVPQPFMPARLFRQGPASNQANPVVASSRGSPFLGPSVVTTGGAVTRLPPQLGVVEAARPEGGVAGDCSHHQTAAVGACASETLVLSTSTREALRVYTALARRARNVCRTQGGDIPADRRLGDRELAGDAGLDAVAKAVPAQ